MSSKKGLRIVLLEILGPIVQRLRYQMLQWKGYRNISRGVTIERNVNLDRVYPGSIHIGEGSLVASAATILSHEHVYRDPVNPELPLHKPVYIGKRCFIGVAAVILPGVHIGDDCLVGAGTVVSKDIPAGSIAVGVPAKIIRSGIRMSPKAVLLP